MTPRVRLDRMATKWRAPHRVGNGNGNGSRGGSWGRTGRENGRVRGWKHFLVKTFVQPALVLPALVLPAFVLPAFLLPTFVLFAPLPANAAPSQPLGKIDQDLVASVFAEICRLNIQHPEMVMRQAILETGWMRSPFLMKRQNLFGFRNTRYLVFDDWKDSVAYYKAWQDKHYRASQHKDYNAFLVSIRYASAGYTEHLRKIRWEQTCPEPSPDAAEPPTQASPLQPLLPLQPLQPAQPVQTLQP